jgi:hypothetical protein
VGNKVEKIDIDYIFDLYPELKGANVEVYIDVENKKEANRIKAFLNGRSERKKFNRILYEILRHRFNDSLYQKVKGFADVAEMRFIGKFFGNARIYCKEITEKGKKVIMVSLLYKSQRTIKDDAGTKTAAEKISKLTYTIPK